MRKDAPIDNLIAASRLLSTLEQFMSALSRHGAGGIPWDGLQLTLRQSRELITAANLDLQRIECESGAEVDPFAKVFAGHPRVLRRLTTVPKRRRAA